MGFISPVQLTKSKPISTIPRCQSCGLYRECKSPKMPLSGDGREGILIVAEAPGKDEDEQGTQLIGSSGQLLREELEALGIDLDRDCWKTNAIVCRPKNNRTPTDKEIGHCRPQVVNAIRKHEPKVVILLGDSAVRSLIGWTWRESPGPVGRWVGWQIPDQKTNVWICPTWHPAYLLYANKQYSKGRDPRVALFREHLKAAVKLNGRPWGVVPDWQSDVNVELDVDLVVPAIRRAMSHKLVAVDYETNMLKPDVPDARIVSCAVAWGDASGPVGNVSYPWTKATAAATGRLLRSSVKKIIANQGFELRWTLREFGHGIRNVVWDTMHAAHILNNERGIASVKFQAYALLGQPSWDEHIKEYLKAKYSNESNRIDRLGVHGLLTYGGLDAMLEYMIAVKQAKMLGMEI